MKSLKSPQKVTRACNNFETLINDAKKGNLLTKVTVESKKVETVMELSTLEVIKKLLNNKTIRPYSKEFEIIKMVSDEAKVQAFDSDFKTLVNRCHLISENTLGILEKSATEARLEIKNKAIQTFLKALEKKNKVGEKTQSLATSLIGKGILTNVKLERDKGLDYIKISFSKSMKSKIENESFLTKTQKKTKTRTFNAKLYISEIKEKTSVSQDVETDENGKILKVVGNKKIDSSIVVTMELHREKVKLPLFKKDLTLTGYNILSNISESIEYFSDSLENKTPLITLLTKHLFVGLYDQVKEYQEKELQRLDLGNVEKKLKEIILSSKSLEPQGFFCHEKKDTQVGEIAYRNHDSYNQSKVSKAIRSRTEYENHKDLGVKVTKKMEQGTKLHQFLLERVKFKNEMIIEEDYSFSKHQLEVLKLFKNVIKRDDLNKFENIHKTITERYPVVSQILKESLNEITFFHHDKVKLTKNSIKSGLYDLTDHGRQAELTNVNVVCKGKLDIYVDKPSKKLRDLINEHLAPEGLRPLAEDDVIMADIKYTADYIPEDFHSKNFKNNQFYPIQVGHYSRAIEVIDNKKLADIRVFYILIDSKTEVNPEVNILEIPYGDVEFFARNYRDHVLSKAALFDGLFDDYLKKKKIKVEWSNKGRLIQSIPLFGEPGGGFLKHGNNMGLDINGTNLKDKNNSKKKDLKKAS
jgi:hypothetical protein